ncbi:MAG: hypothetical protein GY854_24460 [Deltaproteobacteria bacterium]|nr:hypothetical protein [Deltaproteobacteria bacterium]
MVNRGFLHTCLAFVIAIVPVSANAEEVACPVCGQTFSDETGSCPNDGTDLKMLGKRKDEVDEVDEDPSLPENTEDRGNPSKYQRLDEKMGKRRPVKSKTEKSDYSDRRSRLKKTRRGRSSAAERRRWEKEHAEFVKQDRQLLSEYEAQRASSWKDQERTRLAEARARRDRDAAEARLLNGLGAPLTSLGYRLFWMGEGNDAGAVNAAEIDINLARYRLRAGLSSLIGVRTLSGRDELVFLEHISVGFQKPSRFSPFIVFRGGIGILAGERFGRELVYLLTSIGLEVGIDAWATPWIALTPSMGYERCMLDDAYWNSFTFKISIGF